MSIDLKLILINVLSISRSFHFMINVIAFSCCHNTVLYKNNHRATTGCKALKRERKKGELLKPSF